MAPLHQAQATQLSPRAGTWTGTVSESEPLIRYWVSLTSATTGLSHEFRAWTDFVQPGVSIVGIISSRTQARAASLSATGGVLETGGAVAIAAPVAAGVSGSGLTGATSFLAVPSPSGPDFGRGRSTCTEEMSVWKSKACPSERSSYDDVPSPERWSIRMTSPWPSLLTRFTSFRIRRIADRDGTSTRTYFDSKGSSTR